jgi:hypothetical protein
LAGNKHLTNENDCGLILSYPEGIGKSLEGLECDLKFKMTVADLVEKINGKV